MACSRTKMLGKNGGGVTVNFGGSQSLCLHLHIPESVQYPGPGWYTVCADFGASPRRALQRPKPPPAHHHLPGYPRCLRLPRGLPVQPRIIPASELPIPPSRFRPTHGRGQPYSPKPSVPPAPRPPASTANPAAHPAAASTQPSRTLSVADASPDGCTAHSTAVAVVSSTPYPASTDLQPRPSTRQA